MHRITILIVDDDPCLRDAIAENFRLHGYTVLEAENGKKAFEIFRNNKIDVVITDNDMPVMSGLSLTRAIREFSQVPVAIITGGILSRDSALACGATEFFSKPFDICSLENFVNNVRPSLSATG